MKQNTQSTIINLTHLTHRIHSFYKYRYSQENHIISHVSDQLWQITHWMHLFSRTTAGIWLNAHKT